MSLREKFERLLLGKKRLNTRRKVARAKVAAVGSNMHWDNFFLFFSHKLYQGFNDHYMSRAYAMPLN